MFVCLKLKPNIKLGFFHSEPLMSEKIFKEYDWKYIYKDANELILNGSPELRGDSVTIHCFVDADYSSK